MVTDIEVANVVLECVDLKVAKNKIVSFKVAHRIEAVKGAKFVDDEFEKRPFDFCGFC